MSTDDPQNSSNDPQDGGAGAVPLNAAQIQAFWQAFTALLPVLEPQTDRDFVEQGNDLLQSHAPGLALELERGPKGEPSLLVISAHGSLDQFENAQKLVQHAPAMAGYKVQAFRSRALGSDFTMGMEGFSLACSDVLVAHYDAGGIVGLELTFEKIIPHDMRDHARHMAFIMLDHVLGEWDFAVRVGPVEFVDAFSDDVEGAEPLSVFPPIFDAFVRDQLGRSYQFPTEDEDSWSVLEVRAQDASEDSVPDLLSLRESANAVATRADLAYCLQLRYGFDSQQQLDQARDAQDALDVALAQQHAGLLVFTRVEDMSARVAAYYVDNAAAAAQLAQQISRKHAASLEPEISVAFDPSWQEYLALYAAARGDGVDDADDGE